MSGTTNEETLRREIGAVQKTLETRLDAMDKAAIILEQNVNRVPTLLDRETSRLQTLFDQKIEALETRMDDLKQTSSGRAIDVQRFSETAVNAAFAASKEASTKAELNAKELTNNIREQVALSTGAQGAILDDLKQRLTRLEERRLAGHDASGAAYQARSGENQQQMLWIAILAIIASAVVSIGISLFSGSRSSSALPYYPSPPGAITVQPPASVQTR